MGKLKILETLEPVCCKKRQKIVPDQLLVCGVTTRKSCWQPEMSGWIQVAMQQNTIFSPEIVH